MKRRIVSFLLVVVMCAVVPAYVVFANTTALMEAAPIGESMEIASATPAEGVPAEVPAEAAETALPETEMVEGFDIIGLLKGLGGKENIACIYNRSQ